MSSGITIKQIAELAGVHRSTVDKVIHNRPGVSDQVRHNVQGIIDSVNYKPNAIGKALKRQHKKLKIAAVLVCIHSTSAILEGIMNAYSEFSRLGMDIEYHFVPYGDIDEQARIIDMLIRKNVDGVVIASYNDEKIIQSVNRMVDKGIPVVTVNTDLMPSKRMCYVGQNHETAGRTAARLTAEMLYGKGRIAIISGSDKYISATKERFNGFYEHIQDTHSGIKVVEVINISENAKQMYDVVYDLLKRTDVDYIYATAGGVSGAGKAIKQLKMEGQVKIISHDIYPEVVDLIREGIITCSISQDNIEQGYLSVKILFEYLFYGEKPSKGCMFTKTDIFLLENIPDNDFMVPAPILEPEGLMEKCREKMAG